MPFTAPPRPSKALPTKVSTRQLPLRLKRVATTPVASSDRVKEAQIVQLIQSPTPSHRSLSTCHGASSPLSSAAVVVAEAILAESSRKMSGIRQQSFGESVRVWGWCQVGSGVETVPILSFFVRPCVMERESILFPSNKTLVENNVFVSGKA